MLQIEAKTLKALIDGIEMPNGESLPTRVYDGHGAWGPCLAYTVPDEDLLASVAQIMAEAEFNGIDLDKMVDVVASAKWHPEGRGQQVVYFPRLDAENLVFAPRAKEDERALDF